MLYKRGVYVCERECLERERMRLPERKCWMNGWSDGWMDGWKDGWMDGRMDGWTNGWMDGRMEGWTDGHKGCRFRPRAPTKPRAPNTASLLKPQASTKSRAPRSPNDLEQSGRRRGSVFGRSWGRLARVWDTSWKRLRAI